jgi:Small Multidrug Resistance protein
MAWFYILFADLFEIAWPFVLKWSAPISRWAPLLVVIICAIPANYLLAEAVQRLAAVEFVFAITRLTFDDDRRELRRGAELIALEPQIFDLLVYLVRNRDRQQRQSLGRGAA